MTARADAHLHFFKPGYAAVLPENCRRGQPDEITLYKALAEQHDITQVLAVGYEGEGWAAGNNQYLAELAGECHWLRPVYFVAQPQTLTIPTLEQLRQQRFAGLSFYVFDEPMIAALSRMPDEVWGWLVRRKWLVSVNSRGDYWNVWPQILGHRPQLRLLVSHLGLPPAAERSPTKTEARLRLKSVVALAQFPGARVKLSGFYALTQPGYDYPHPAAWPYVETLLQEFGSTRLLWGSDFSPSLEWVSFPQTFGLFAHMSFLTTDDIERIEGGNLLALLNEVE